MGKVNVAGKLYLISCDDKKNYQYSNSLLVDDEAKLLVDTGAKPDQLKKLANENKIDILINSHYHTDHVRGNWMFPDASLWAPSQDALAIDSFEKFLEMTGFKTSPRLTKHFQKLKGDLFDKRRKVKVKYRFRDNHEFDLGDTTLRVVHAPGHTPGHSCFFEAKNKFLFSTDVDLTNFGPWYGNVASDIDDFIDSVERLQRLKPRIAASSHSGPFEGRDKIDLLLEKYIDIIYQREEKILALLKTEKTLEDLLGRGIVYRKFGQPEDVFRFFEHVMLEKHLKRLVELGDVEQLDDMKYKAVP
jgi:glyoxylase-like metal-dependent hydrolase (beta-lactamase superfamily II)